MGTEEGEQIQINDEKPTKAAETLLSQESRILNDIAGGSGFSFKKGSGWSINRETGEATYDTSFFEESGYSSSQALFGAMHELKCHLVVTAELIDTPNGANAYESLKIRMKEKKWLHVWENTRTDVKGNKAILKLAPSLEDEVKVLYKQKLWQESDFSKLPKHLQLMNSILRSSMVPEEAVKVDPIVAELIKNLRNIKGKDVIALATDPSLDPLLALKLSERYIEPVIESLYKEDLREKSTQGDNEGREQNNPFKKEYEEQNKRNPKPFKDEDIEQGIKEFKKFQSTSSRQEAGYEQESGVSAKDIKDYAKEYQEVEKYIEPLRQVFRRIIEQRKVPLRRLVSLKNEGVMIDPGLVAQTFLDVKAGIEEPRTMKDFEGILVDENVPRNFEITIITDRTGSMISGTKIEEQRRSCVLLMEALREFSNMTEDLGPLTIGLDVKSEVRSFGDDPKRTEILKPLSNELTEKQRVAVFKSLAIADSGINNEEVVLEEVYKSIQQEVAQNPTYLEDIKKGKVRKIIIILTDGRVGNLEATRKELDRLRNLGVVVLGIGMTKGGEDAKVTYAPDSKVCEDVKNLPRTIEEILSEHLGLLSIDGNLKTISQTL